ncbi:Cytochrome c oxidase assembly protein cox15 [Lecanora helva]
MASMLPVLRQVAPKLTKKLFDCSECRSSTLQKNVLNLRQRPIQKHILKLPGSSRHSIRWVSHTAGTSPKENFKQILPDLPVARSASRPETGVKARFFPRTSEKLVGYWLLGSAASVFGIVVFGGLTRLTESGLSITEWRPVTGSLPPTSAEAWDSEFSLYRASPEFQRLNPHMTLSEFKSIYYMEWTHRLWGRIVGISFIVPAVYFIARRKVSASMALRIVGIGGLIGFQGFLGWWMVKSGLKDDLFAPGSHPRVSQYRLVAHLGTAFLCYSAMLWNGLSILRTNKFLQNLESAENNLARLRNPRLKVFRSLVGALTVLVFTTAMSGGLVAGLDAGLIYNEFPYMGVGLTPPKSELFSNFYSHRDDKSDTWWRNPLENPSLVQLDHRILATTTFTSVMALWAYSRFSPNIRRLLPAPVRKGVHGVVGFAWLQVILGISTLIYLVPLPLASAHQAGALALLSYVLVLGNRTGLPNRRVSKLLAEKFTAARMTPKKKIVMNPAIHTRINTLKATPELQAR